MKEVIVMSCSMREGRKTHNVAEFVCKILNEKEGLKAFVQDLKEFNLPMFIGRISEENATGSFKKFQDEIV